MKRFTYNGTTNRNKTTTRRRRGFTLVELLIVMAILVLLASLVGPRLLGSKKKADIQATQTQIGLFQACLERYALDMNKFPSTEEGLQALVTAPTGDEMGSMSMDTTDMEGAASSTGGGTASKWDGPYLQKMDIPADPWGNPYQYEYPPTHGAGDQPDIWSYGPDGTADTEDDIVSWSRSAEGSGEFSDSQPMPQPELE